METRYKIEKKVNHSWTDVLALHTYETPQKAYEAIEIIARDRADEYIVLPVLEDEDEDDKQDSTIESTSDNETKSIWKLVEDGLPTKDGQYLVGRNRSDPHKSLGTYVAQLGGFIQSNANIDSLVYCWADVGQMPV